MLAYIDSSGGSVIASAAAAGFKGLGALAKVGAKRVAKAASPRARREAAGGTDTNTGAQPPAR